MAKAKQTVWAAPKSAAATSVHEPVEWATQVEFQKMHRKVRSLLELISDGRTIPARWQVERAGFSDRRACAAGGNIHRCLLLCDSTMRSLAANCCCNPYLTKTCMDTFHDVQTLGRRIGCRTPALTLSEAGGQFARVLLWGSDGDDVGDDASICTEEASRHREQMADLGSAASLGATFDADWDAEDPFSDLGPLVTTEAPAEDLESVEVPVMEAPAEAPDVSVDGKEAEAEMSADDLDASGALPSPPSLLLYSCRSRLNNHRHDSLPTPAPLSSRSRHGRF